MLGGVTTQRVHRPFIEFWRRYLAGSPPRRTQSCSSPRYVSHGVCKLDQSPTGVFSRDSAGIVNKRLKPLGVDAIARVSGHGVPNLVRAATSDEGRVVLYAEDRINLDRFFVYELPVPDEFVQTAGNRYIKITLAFDPPTRHTRVDYLGTTMSFRLIRGASLDEIVEYFGEELRMKDLCRICQTASTVLFCQARPSETEAPCKRVYSQ